MPRRGVVEARCSQPCLAQGTTGTVQSGTAQRGTSGPDTTQTCRMEGAREIECEVSDYNISNRVASGLQELFEDVAKPRNGESTIGRSRGRGAATRGCRRDEASTSSRGAKGLNYMPEAERQLIQIVLAISQDPIVGNKQQTTAL